MLKSFSAFAIAATLLTLVSASADDSTAVLGAGGLVFTNKTPIQMAVEDLYVSPHAVRIHFVFANNTNSDVETVVAFPLPDIDTYELSHRDAGISRDDPVNFVAFRAVVDGKPVALKTEQRAFVGTKDVTAQLQAAGAPINPISKSGFDKLNKISAAAFNALKAAGLLEGDKSDIAPKWVVRTRFYWTQRFPAHKSVVIDHSYQPVTGQSFFIKESLAAGSSEIRDYCIDKATAVQIAAKMDIARKAHPDRDVLLIAQSTDYILKTANNWNGPIGKFVLTLDKLKPDNVLSLCWAGVITKKGPTTFEAVRTNFSPSQDIHLLVVTNTN